MAITVLDVEIYVDQFVVGVHHLHLAQAIRCVEYPVVVQSDSLINSRIQSKVKVVVVGHDSRLTIIMRNRSDHG